QFQHKIHIHELAALLSISEGHFCRFFKSLLKQTPIEYINSVRINHAIKLLHNPDLKIIDIALDVGFDNLSYFIKTFKRYKKCTPSEFRQQLFNK
ncbi:MAG: AraC family transcriptional regulator, partial [Bacilli bacterium]|nr:AraC family transcriptional regulator [Bacilli bacterium]